MEGGEEPLPSAVTRAVAFLFSPIVGILIGIPFAFVYPFVATMLPWRNHALKVFAYGSVAFLVFSLLPLLAVPGRPPGVESNLDVSEREFWFVGTMVSAFGGVLAGFALYHLFSPRASARRSRGILLGASLAVVAVLWSLPFLLKPEITPITELPRPFLELYFYLTVLEWAIFWTVLSAVLAVLWPRPRSPPILGK